MLPTVLVVVPLRPESQITVANAFNVITALDQLALDKALTNHASEIRAVLTNGTIGFDATSIAKLPNLELIGALGAGYENIARDAAQASGIVVVKGNASQSAGATAHRGLLVIEGTRQRAAVSR